MMRRVVLATRSAGKVRELSALAAVHGVATITLDAMGLAADPLEVLIEVHDTLEENARAKADWFAARLPGECVLAEDSGLEVSALGGKPGVHSKRWAGLATSLSGQALDDGNNAALVRALRGAADRSARYRCVAVLVDGARIVEASGACEGRIVEAPHGAGGFGYDPHFHSHELGKTFAAASVEEKSRVSHRARAVRAVLDAWLR